MGRIAEILRHYNHDLGQINQAIETRNSPFEVHELIRAYIQEANELPPILMGGDIPGPDEYPELWEEESVESMRTYGDLRGTPAYRMIQQHILGEPGSIIERARESAADIEASFAESQRRGRPGGGVLKMDHPGQLRETLLAFMRMGNPGLVLTLFAAFGVQPQNARAKETLVDGMYDSLELRQDHLDSLYDIDPESETAQAEQQEISTLISDDNNFLATTRQMIQELEDSFDDLLESASQMTESHYRTLSTINRNLG